MFLTMLLAVIFTALNQELSRQVDFNGNILSGKNMCKCFFKSYSFIVII